MARIVSYFDYIATHTVILLLVVLITCETRFRVSSYLCLDLFANQQKLRALNNIFIAQYVDLDILLE